MFYVLGSFVEKCTPVRKDGGTYQKKKNVEPLKPMRRKK